MLESAARGLSRYGYGNLVLEQVARDAGYTRGALYHQFEDKEDLALAVIEWVNENWAREVGRPAKEEPDPVAELIALARGHAVFCRRDIARVVMALRVEFSGQDHPVGREIERITEAGVKRVARLIDAGRKRGRFHPARPPGRSHWRFSERSRAPLSRSPGELHTTSYWPPARSGACSGSTVSVPGWDELPSPGGDKSSSPGVCHGYSGRRWVTTTPYSAARRSPIRERWQASGSRSTHISAAACSMGSSATTASRSARSRISAT